MGRQAVDASRDFLGFCREQPLILGGLGLALGAIMGAIIPPTETEDRLVGEASDRAKEQARETAAEQYEKGKAAVTVGVERARAEAKSQGFAGGTEQPEHEAGLVPDKEPMPEEKREKGAAGPIGTQ